MDSIPPGRLLAPVRPGNDLVLRRNQNLKRCVQACGCNITTPWPCAWADWSMRLHEQQTDLWVAPNKLFLKRRGESCTR